MRSRNHRPFRMKKDFPERTVVLSSDQSQSARTCSACGPFSRQEQRSRSAGPRAHQGDLRKPAFASLHRGRPGERAREGLSERWRRSGSAGGDRRRRGRGHPAIRPVVHPDAAPLRPTGPLRAGPTPPPQRRPSLAPVIVRPAAGPCAARIRAWSAWRMVSRSAPFAYRSR